MFASFNASQNTNQETSSSKKLNESKSYTCTLYQDYLVFCDSKTPKCEKNNLIIYNLKLQKIEVRDKIPKMSHLLNHCACFCEEKEGIILYGDLEPTSDSQKKNKETYRIVYLKLQKNSDDKFEYKPVLAKKGCGPTLPSATSYLDQGVVYFYQPGEANGNFGSLHSYPLETAEWTNHNVDFANLRLDKPSHNVIFCDGVLYLLAANDGLFNQGSYQAVYSMNLRKGENQHKWEKVLASGQAPGLLTNTSMAEANGIIYLFGLTTKGGETKSVLWRYNTKSKEWREIQEIGTLTARRNQKAIIYGEQLLIVNRNFEDDFMNPIEVQYYDLKNVNQNVMTPSVPENSDNNTKKRELCRDQSEDLILRGSKSLYESKVFPDVTFEVEGQEVPAHKAILASRSNYFMKMFTSGMSESHSNKISIPHVKIHVFNAILQYLYCNEVELDEELALDLIPVVDEYLIKGLRKLIEGYLCKQLREANVADILIIADQHEIEGLKSACFDFIVKNYEKIDKEEELTKLSKSLLIELLTLTTSASYNSSKTFGLFASNTSYIPKK